MRKKYISDTLFSTIIALLFFGFVFSSITHHEMWHDETSEWLIAKDSPTYASLLSNYSAMRHPAGWVSCLWILSRFTSNMFSIQLLNLLFVTLAVFIFLRFSPFSRPFKILFAFGYFPVYEYGTISREYALGMLMLFILAALYKHRGELFLYLSFVVFVLANASILTFLFSVLFFIFLVFDIPFLIKNVKGRRKQYKVMAGFGLMLLGILFSLFALKPFTADKSHAAVFYNILSYLGNILQHGSVSDVVSFLFFNLKRMAIMAFLPVPIPTLQFWYTNIFTTSSYLSLPLSASIILFTIILFIRQKKCFRNLWLTILFSFYLLSLILFHRFCVRHYGFLFLFFIVCLWVSFPQESCVRLSFFKNRIANMLSKNLILLTLVVHILGMSVAVFFDWNYSFSSAKQVATYINTNHLENKTIIGWRDDFMPSIVAYANLKQIYYPQGQRFGSFVIFDEARQGPLTITEVIQPVFTLNKEPDDIIFIFTPELLDSKQIETLEDYRIMKDSNQYQFKRIAVFGPAIVIGESFLLYELKKVDS